MKKNVRQIPPIHELQKDPRFMNMQQYASRDQLTKWLQEIVASFRIQMLSGEKRSNEFIHTHMQNNIFKKLDEKIDHFFSYQLRRVINATGTVLHTNLGRARLSEEAVQQVVETASSYSNVEYHLERGERGSRHDLIENMIREVTGAEAAMVVNNNAAAVYLILKAFSQNREVIVSRGELVEIGGSFRVSSIMKESGAKLVEVGTTNKTHLFDYEQAISEDTAIILKVHQSNFKMIGFTQDVATSDLRTLSEKHHVLLYEDLGSGVLFDFKKHDIGHEPTIKESLENGADIVSFSGDKLLGGPQAGIIAGKKKWIESLKKHQLARVLRVDKMTLAALEATLQLYMKEEDAIQKLPTLRSVLLTKEEIRKKVDDFVADLSSKWTFDITQDVSQVGGGTMPGVELDTYVLHLSHPTLKAQKLHEQLRRGTPAVVTRITDDRITLDFRTIEENEFNDIYERLSEMEG